MTRRNISFPAHDLHFYEDYSCPLAVVTERPVCIPPRIVCRAGGVTLAMAKLTWAEQFGDTGPEFFGRVVKYVTEQGGQVPSKGVSRCS